jgi:hypothetical protein
MPPAFVFRSYSPGVMRSGSVTTPRLRNLPFFTIWKLGGVGAFLAHDMGLHTHLTRLLHYRACMEIVAEPFLHTVYHV